MASAKDRSKVWDLVFMAVVAVSFAIYVYLCWFTPEKRAVRHRLSEADSKSESAIQQRIEPLRDLFAKGKKGSKAFAEEALSWSGKWAVIKGLLDGGESHREFLSEAFERHIFSSDELKAAMERAVRGYQVDLEGIESELLVQLRVDLANLGDGSLPPHLLTDEVFRQEYRKLAAQVSSRATVDLGVAAGREIALLTASEVATQAAIQASRAVAADTGVESGLLTVGAASALETLGVGLIIAVILDYVIDSAFRAVGYDPTEKIANHVRESLDRMEAALTADPPFYSFEKKGSLRQQMEQLHEARSGVRRQTIQRLLAEGGDK